MYVCMYVCMYVSMYQCIYVCCLKKNQSTPRHSELVGIFLCTGTAISEFNYAGEARKKIGTPSFWKQKRRAARFATSSSLFATYLVVISSDFNTDFCVAHTAVRRW